MKRGFKAFGYYLVVHCVEPVNLSNIIISNDVTRIIQNVVHFSSHQRRH